MKLVFVSTGNPMMGRDFRDELKIPSATILSDTRRETYQHLGFKRGLFSFLNPKFLRAGKRAKEAGFTQERVLGDPLQQGGVVVVKRGGAAVYGFASATAGDHPPIKDVLEAARKAAG